MSDIPRMPGLRDTPVEDPDTIGETKYLGSIPPRYSFDRPKYKFKFRGFELVGTTYDEELIAKAKVYYKARGLHVRVKKHEALSYGRYWDIYVGNGTWREYTSSTRSG